MKPVSVLMGLCLFLMGCMSTADISALTKAIPTVAAAPAPAVLTDVSAREAGALNALRAGHGLPGLHPDPVLASVARGHAQDMLDNGFFGHVSSDGGTIVDRAQAQGYVFCHVAENLAKGQRNYGTVMQQWMGSPAHRMNLLHEDVTGFGLIHGPGNLWVLVLGKPGCANKVGNVLN